VFGVITFGVTIISVLFFSVYPLPPKGYTKVVYTGSTFETASFIAGI